LFNIWQKLTEDKMWFDTGKLDVGINDPTPTSELHPFHRATGLAYKSDDVRNIETQLNYTYAEYPKDAPSLKAWVNKTFGGLRSAILDLGKDETNGISKGLNNHYVVNLIYSR
jgi:hypothetical protein